MNEHRMTVEEAEQNAGCWIGGSRGWTVSGRVVDIAAEHGMVLDADDRMILNAYLDPERTGTVELSTGELLSADDVMGAVADQGGLADKATEWLNEQVAPEGWQFVWTDGELLLLEGEPCERCGEYAELDTDSGLCPACVEHNNSRVVL